MPIRTLNINIELDAENTPVLKINVGPEHISYSDFVKEGYLKIRNEPSNIKNSIIEVKDVIVTPNNNEV